MIQRIQTVFLLGVVICMAAVIIFPIWEKSDPATEMRYTLDAFYWQEFQAVEKSPDSWQLQKTKPTYYLAGLGALICLTALYSIFQFKKRTTQVKLGALNAFLMMAYIAVATYLIYGGESALGTDSRGIFKPGYFLPLAAMIFNSLANRFIKKDEDLVRSVDRIR